MRVSVLDYGMGNVRSVCNALTSLGIENQLTDKPNEIMEGRGLVIPGVGAFEAGMARIRERKLATVIKNYIETGRPTLGVCLGMQMLFEMSAENGNHEGLGFLEGSVNVLGGSGHQDLRLPHIGWTSVNWRSIPATADARYYFVHSYVVEPKDRAHIEGISKYGDLEFVSAVRRGNLMGVQFHPERSGRWGLDLLKSFFGR